MGDVPECGVRKDAPLMREKKTYEEVKRVTAELSDAPVE